MPTRNGWWCAPPPGDCEPPAKRMSAASGAAWHSTWNATNDRSECYDSARTRAEQVAAALLDAVERETLSLEQAQLLYATSVAGIPAVGAAALIGLPKSRGVYHALAKAEAALAASPA